MRTWIIALFCLTFAVALTNTAKVNKPECEDRKGTCLNDRNDCQGKIVAGFKCPPKKKNCCIPDGKPKKCKKNKGTCIGDGNDCQGRIEPRFWCPLEKKKNCCIPNEKDDKPQVESKAGSRANRCREPRPKCKKIEGECIPSSYTCKRPSIAGSQYCKGNCQCCYKKKNECKNKQRCDENKGVCQFRWHPCDGVIIRGPSCKGNKACRCCAACRIRRPCKKLGGECQSASFPCNGERQTKGCQGPDCVCCYVAPITTTASPMTTITAVLATTTASPMATTTAVPATTT